MKKHLIYLAVLVLVFCQCEIQEVINPVNLELHAGLNLIDLEYDGLIRSLYIILPSDYSDNRFYPLIFFFHGLGGNKEFGLSVFDVILKNQDIIGVSPQGHLNSWNTLGGKVPSTEDDIGYSLYILECLKESVQVNEQQVYSMGYSNGGAFSYTLALNTNTFAAVASISASFREGMTIPPATQKLSIVQVHGELDAKVPYHGGQSSALPISFESAMNTIQQWVRHNEISEVPTIEYPSNMSVHIFQDIGNPYEVRFYTLLGTTHHIITHEYISSDQCYIDILEFFKRHSKTAD